ncbi:Pre-mRNA-processing factor 39 [Atta colombica]|uniref:Pre-mRNA-processing factor 39 n=1 Tax=Atta colombica TaxID=520822 RepID=A0A195B657_9HYME|nr:PREDICTED: pre-mRNA-processing factor 39 [Atta colombica]KYM79991.1 Pre-mRNA-processing factor 39 [Atta colombica]
MSSASGDEAEVALAEPVRRTRSGRARKTTVAKKPPVKKLLARATRFPKKVHEIEEIEEETTSMLEEEVIESMPENGVQRVTDVIVEQRSDEDSSTLHLQLEDSEDANIQEMNMDQNEEMEQDVEEIEHSNIRSEGIIMEESSMDKVEILGERGDIEVEGQDVQLECQDVEMEGQDSNDDSNQQRVLIDFQEVINEDGNTMTQEILEAEEIDGSENMSMHTGTRIQVMEIDEQEISEDVETVETVETIEAVETVMDKIEEPEMEVSQSDSLPRIEITAVENEENEETEEIQEYITEDDTKKIGPDTEAVSEDELPTEAAAKEPETEAVSDEELPVAGAADLGETESVSEDELPPDSDKKRKHGAKSIKTLEKKTKAEGGTKRKLNAEGEYDPSSPTSENNDEAPAKKVALSSDTEAGDKQEIKPASPKKKTLPELEKYWKAVNEDPSDFTGWTYLLQYVDQENDAEAAREAYTKFLERYPYCYGYWRKFADYEKKKGNPENVQTVFDQGLKAISLSVDLWLHYINHCKTVYEKDEEKLREQYERAIQACGLEFRSDRLWESYIKWESEGKRLSRVTALYDRLLSTPTLGYTSHFEAFQEFVSSNLPNRILSVDDFLALRAEVKALLKSDDATTTSAADDAPPGEEPPPHEVPPTDEETRAIREKIISSRRKMHKANVNAVAARWTYEEGIKRPYFHVKPLERCQLKNWKEYLDFEIEQKDQNRIIILFERCLIACALYDEFWMRFVRYLESLKGDNTEKIRDVYSRACMVHHPKKPNLHLQWAIFEEGQDNFETAATILENIDNVLPNMLQVAYRRINLERRRGDLEKACILYENYITNSKNRTIANNIAVKYARFLCKVKDDVDKAIKVLMKATEKDKDNPRLYLQLIDLAMQRTPVDTQEIVGYMDMFIEREHADLEQRVLFAQRKVEFLEDFSPDIRQVLKAHEQFQKCIKQAKERKKTKSDDNKTDSSPPKKKTDQSNVPPSPSVGSQSSYQYSSGPSGPYQSPQQFQGGQYGGQGGYQQGYQQYPPPSDPNYANYQNWQYGQGGPQAYGPYNQWGSYNYY